MNGDMPRSDYAAYLDELDFRVQRLQMMIEGFTRQAEQSLLTQVNEQKRSVLLITCGVVVVLLLLGWLGFTTWYRVNSKIGAIIHALNALVNEEEKEKKSQSMVVTSSLSLRSKSIVWWKKSKGKLTKYCTPKSRQWQPIEQNLYFLPTCPMRFERR